MYVYIKSEPSLWTVGFYDPSGEWQPESDHSAADDAAKRAAYLNGTPAPVVPDGWLRAIDEMLVVDWIGTAKATDTYEVARDKLHQLIEHNVRIATDPAVNGGWKLVPVDQVPVVPDDEAVRLLRAWLCLKETVAGCKREGLLAIHIDSLEEIMALAAAPKSEDKV